MTTAEEKIMAIRVKATKKTAVISVDALFAELTLNEKDTAAMEASEFLIDGTVVRGHITAYPAPPNGGKTALFTYFSGVLAKKGLKVFYFDVDSPPDALKRREEYARQNGFKVICPDAKVGKSISDAHSILRKLANGEERLDDVVLVIDTLKKFVGMLDKGLGAAFYTLLRQITARGATICLLSHTNKYKDSEGNPIFEGTNDHRSDVDDMVYLMSSKDEDTGILEVTTKPDKLRALFFPRSFRIHTRDGLRVEECAEVLTLLDEEERLVLKVMQELNGHKQTIQSKLVPTLMEHTPYGRDKVRTILFKLSQGKKSPLGKVTGENNSISYYVRL